MIKKWPHPLSFCFRSLSGLVFLRRPLYFSALSHDQPCFFQMSLQPFWSILDLFTTALHPHNPAYDLTSSSLPLWSMSLPGLLLFTTSPLFPTAEPSICCEVTPDFLVGFSSTEVSKVTASLLDLREFGGVLLLLDFRMVVCFGSDAVLSWNYRTLWFFVS